MKKILLTIIIFSLSLSTIACTSEMTTNIEDGLREGMKGIEEGIKEGAEGIQEGLRDGGFVGINNVNRIKNYKNTISLNEEFELEEEFNNLKIELIPTNLIIEYGNENKIEYTGDKKLDEYKLEFEVSDNILKINEYLTKNIRKSINSKLILTLEKDIYDTLNIDLISGNLETEKLIGNKNIYIDLVSGNIKIDSIEGDNLTIDTISGSTNINNIDLKTIGTTSSTSGNINLGNIETKEFHSDTISGNLNIENIHTRKSSISSTSGKVKINKGDLDKVNISAISGDININANTKDAYLETTSGSIELNGNSKTINVDNISGDINIIGTNKNSKIYIDSISSNIDIFGNKYKRTVDIKGNDGDIAIESVSGSIKIK